MTPATLPVPKFSGTRLRDDARPDSAWREELRRIPNLRNSISIVSLYAQTGAVIGLTLWWNHPLGWLLGVLLMGRTHAQFMSLMHEAAHRLLFSSKRVNDFVGRFLIGYPAFTNTDAYRRVHMAHHRDEFGPEEPDIPLYANYPISRDSWRRKLWRDATGQTGWKLLKQQFGGLRGADPLTRRSQQKIFAMQVVLIAISVALGAPEAYFVLWLLPHLTVWRVINRLRSVAEHGGMRRGDDRRIATHSVRQTLLARFFLVPFNIGFHLSHHVDAGIPFRSLPKFHRELKQAGYLTDGLEYRTYRSLWQALRAG
ncbi:MAG: fatty acid desaturase family protein [Ilumatobacteraceae bacterium]